VTVDLRFWRQVSPSPGGIDLRFGDGPPPASNEVVGTLAAALPAVSLPPFALSATGYQRVVVGATLSATLPAPALSLAFEATETVPRTLGVLAASLPPAQTALGVAVSAEIVKPSTLAASLPAVGLPPVAILAAAVDYDQALPDAIGPGINARHVATRDDPVQLAVQQQPMLATRTPAKAHQTTADPLHTSNTLGQQQMIVASRASAQRAHHGLPLGNGRTLGHTDTLRQRRTITTPAQHAIPLAAGTHSAHQERIRFRHRLRADQQQAEHLTTRASPVHQEALRTATRRYVGQQQMLPLPLGWWQIAYPYPEPPFDPNAPSSPVALKFCRLADGTTALVFGCPKPQQPGTGTVVVPISEVYLVINDFSLVRVDTGQPIDVEDFSATLDADSWTWGWSATLHADLMPMVRSPALGEHVELRATVNGTPLHLVVERMGRDRRFADARLKIAGRGRAAWLAAPHAPIETRYNAEARTAQQLLADALTINGVSIGWSIDWRLSDWLVPAGAWSHQGSYMDAATRIAEAGGGYVQAHNTAQQLIILPRYPAAPWHWTSQTPDIDLPEDVCEVEGIEWQDKPAHNAVWVHGGASGRRDRIRRAGTAADRTAPTIIDPLATAPEMTRQRGLAALGDTGRQAHITLRLPVLAETGIIQPGKLIRYTESGVSRLGLSRSVQIDQRFPDLWQTIRIETHELEPV